MKCFDVREATRADVVQCCETALDESVREHPEQWQVYAKNFLQAGPAFSVYFEGQLVGCGGFCIPREGIANAWVVMSSTAPYIRQVPTVESLEYIRESLWTMRNLIGIIQKNLGLRSIRTFSLKSFPQSQKLLRAIGFKKLRRESADRYYYRWT